MSRQVAFDITEPSENEYFEKYDEVSGCNAWFLLVFILTSAVNMGESFQLGPQQYTTIDYLLTYLSQNENITTTFNHPIYLQGSEWSCHLSKINITCNHDLLIFELGICKGVGVFVGSTMSGVFADLYGRKPVFLICSSVWILMAYCLTVVQSKDILLAICFLVSSFCQAAQMNVFINFGELANRKTRILCIYTFIMGAVGALLFDFTSHAIGEWKKLSIFAATTTSIVVFACWYLPESPRWLFCKNKKEEAFTHLEDLFGLKFIFKEELVEQGNGTQINIFINMIVYLWKRRLKWASTVCVLMAVSTMFHCCGMWKMIIYLFFHRQLKWLFIVIEVASYLFIAPIYVCLGKRFSLLFIYIITVVISLSAILVTSIRTGVYYALLQVVLGLSTKNLLLAYSLDIFPTFIRGLVFGILGMISGLVTVCCTLVLDRMEITTDQFNYHVSLFLASLFGPLVLLLPNTSRQDLPNFKMWTYF